MRNLPPGIRQKIAVMLKEKQKQGLMPPKNPMQPQTPKPDLAPAVQVPMTPPSTNLTPPSRFGTIKKKFKF